jgi:hypothetical protein
MSASPASRPCVRGTAVGRAVGNKKGEALLCFVYAGFFGNIGSQRSSLSLNVLESRQLSVSCVSEQRLPRELLIKWSCCWTSISICVQLSSSSPPSPVIPWDEEAHKNGYKFNYTEICYNILRRLLPSSPYRQHKKNTGVTKPCSQYYGKTTNVQECLDMVSGQWASTSPWILRKVYNFSPSVGRMFWRLSHGH